MSTRILVVDDDPNITYGFRRLLERYGYVVKEENDSTKARTTAKEFQPEYAILDYSMPGAHGGDIAWEFANDPQLQSVRVIFCSGLAASEVRSKLPTGRVPVLGKPVDERELLRLLEAHDGFPALDFKRPMAR